MFPQREYEDYLDGSSEASVHLLPISQERRQKHTSPRTQRTFYILLAFAAICTSIISGASSGYLASRTAQKIIANGGGDSVTQGVKQRMVMVHGEKIPHPLQLRTSDDAVLVDLIQETFISNRSYIQPPSQETDELWVSLYPKDKHGLFEWPDSRPQRTGFAGFHQLHCVALKNSEPAPSFEREIDMDHSLHCIEFLRQSVMCNADDNIQTENSYHQGILAFGVTYQCRNWWTGLTRGML
ncbi:uncharacterized protein BDR25DRAFT_315498 [Lindgomyces ingoldianus]|uniref:Uncharacterized protein n=1 Tax=Lindgomyces ingoldianus TaxID=673940 RepID=A0ACB6QS43_9PLEO|nr:uncharacterized protein BDR25DRAFT_315498 [Lindgomyces ingoldianus]KAF2468996.1 hypothetical protein BDR25DRAFT_315498 [Lindgomyces ingoldianus]